MERKGGNGNVGGKPSLQVQLRNRAPTNSLGVSKVTRGEVQENSTGSLQDHSYFCNFAPLEIEE